MDELRIVLGMRVEIELIAGNQSKHGLIAQNKSREKINFVLVPDDAADFDRGLMGMGTPLAKTILGHAAGETLEYKRGDIVQVKILSVQENTETLVDDVSEQREESLRRARDKAELASMVSFALTFDSKWGDYDPEQIVKQYEEQEKKDATQGKSE